MPEPDSKKLCEICDESAIQCLNNSLNCVKISKLFDDNLDIWRRIEEAVTRLTRNQFVRKGTRVRIPPSPLCQGRTYQMVGPFSFGKAVLDKGDWASIGKGGLVWGSRDKENGWK